MFLQNKPTISVAYCGGCNPRFDRTGFIKRLDARLKEPGVSFAWAGAEQKADMRLIVTGCQAMCVAQKLSQPNTINHVIGHDNMDYVTQTHDQAINALVQEISNLKVF